jgi:spore germination protein YaaH
MLLPWYGCVFEMNQTSGSGRVDPPGAGSFGALTDDNGYGEILSELFPNRTGKIEFDETLGSAHFKFLNGSGALHSVWYDDPRAVRLKTNWAKSKGMRG